MGKKLTISNYLQVTPKQIVKISYFAQARPMTVHHVEPEPVRKLLAWPQMANLSQESYGNKPALSVASLLPRMSKQGNM